jgi:hypothetical protein
MDPSKRDHWEKLGVNGKIILRWIFTECTGGGAWVGLIWLRIVTIGGFF